GGLVIDAGFGYTSPNWVGAALAFSALLLAFVSAALDRERPAPGDASAPTAHPVAGPERTPAAPTPL
ncbi:MFS transporter, partial [Streptomyces sp. SID11233]|nr:MFS transporter [Streptomyces sp. SID11233]